MRRLAVLALALNVASAASAEPAGMPWVEVAKDGKGFVLSPSNQPFVPWGFNYDHIEKGRLIEDYWASDWPKVEKDFQEMKKLGANVVRVHLQLGKFMADAKTPNAEAFDLLSKLVKLSESLNLYLDVTGLCCYRKSDVPPWYDKLSKTVRWEIQAEFWAEVAKRVAESPGIFCLDLMNGPYVPIGNETDQGWIGPKYNEMHSFQFISLDQADRPRPEIARQWIRQMTAAIRELDRRHLITVGLLRDSVDYPGFTHSGFVPKKIVNEVDFISVHLNPTHRLIESGLRDLADFRVGKPVVVVETFPTSCLADDFGTFLERSQALANGWMSFYWGKSLAELKRSNDPGDGNMLEWLMLFEQKGKELGR